MKREDEEEDHMGILNVKAEGVETESKKARAMELEAQMFEVERSRVR